MMMDDDDFQCLLRGCRFLPCPSAPQVYGPRMARSHQREASKEAGLDVDRDFLVVRFRKVLITTSDPPFGTACTHLNLQRYLNRRVRIRLKGVHDFHDD